VLKDCVRARGDCWGERERGKGKVVVGGKGGEREGGKVVVGGEKERVG